MKPGPRHAAVTNRIDRTRHPLRLGRTRRDRGLFAQRRTGHIARARGGRDNMAAGRDQELPADAAARRQGGGADLR